MEHDGRILVDGGFSFSDLLERYDLPPVEDEHDTVAGYVIGSLGRIPDQGERVPLGQGELLVLELIDRRVTRLEFRLDSGSGTADDGEAREAS